jgi:hypothetical protein
MPVAEIAEMCSCLLRSISTPLGAHRRPAHKSSLHFGTLVGDVSTCDMYLTIDDNSTKKIFSRKSKQAPSLPNVLRAALSAASSIPHQPAAKDLWRQPRPTSHHT